MRVHDVMKSRPSVCRPQDRLTEAGRTMSRVGCGVLPVVDHEGRLLGVLTDRDICATVTRLDQAPGEVHVAKAMTAEVRTCTDADPIEDALETMKRHRVRRLPVINEEKKVEAILSLDDIAVTAHASGDVSDITWAQVGAALKAISEHQLLARVP